MRNLFIALALIGAPACGKKEPAPVVADAAHDDKGKPPHGHDGEAPHDDKGAPPHEHGGDAAHDDKGLPPHEHGGGHEGGEGHAHKAPHGGEVKTIGGYHLEAVATKAGIMFFPLDAEEKELPLDGISGKLTFVAGGKEPVEATLEPMGNHLHAMVVLDGAWKAAVTLTIKGETLAATFEGKGARAAGMGEEHHHGGDAGHAMPRMLLSDRVEGHAHAENVSAGKPATLHLQYDRKEPHGPVTDFEVTHEKQLHFFIVSEDMSFFAHEHPDVANAAKGTWTLPFTFPVPGRYRLYSDFKSTALGPTVTMTSLVVPGDAPPAKPLVADTELTKTFDGLKVTIATTPATLAVGDALIRYTIADAATGQPLTDLEPYLGAMAHLFILNQDLTSMAHAHPRGPEPTADFRGGPSVDLHTQLPKTGLYKLWGQFKRGGKVITTDWTLEAK